MLDWRFIEKETLLSRGDIILFWRILKRDWFLNINNNRGKYCILFFLIIIMTIINIQLLNRNNGNILDLFYMTYKDTEYKNSNLDFQEFPFIWFLINILISSSIGNYILEDIKKDAYYVLIRCKTYTLYWLSKICFVLIHTLLIYFILFSLTFIIGAIFLNNTLEWSLLFNPILRESIVQSITPLKFILSLFLIYSTTSIVITLLQINLSLFLGKKRGVILIIFILVLSIFSTNQYLPAIHSMLLKHDIFDKAHGLSIIDSLKYNFFLSILLIFIGYKILTKKDIS